MSVLRFWLAASLLVLSGAPAWSQEAAEAAKVATVATDALPSTASPAPAAPTSGPAAEGAAAAAENESQPAPAAAAAKPAPPPLPTPTLTVNIDLAAQNMTVFENGTSRYSWPISSGTAEFATPRGTFRPQWTAKMWYSRKYDNAPMPHAVFINGGVAIHATYHTGALGRPASHGCIRLAPGNAKTFYNLVHRHGLKATKVAVYGTPKFRGPAMASRRVNKQVQYAQPKSNFWGWDWGGAYSTSAYDPNFNKKQRRAASAYVRKQPPRVIYRNGQKYVYVQKPKSNYYNGY